MENSRYFFCQVVVNIVVVENFDSHVYYRYHKVVGSIGSSMSSALWETVLGEIELSVSHANFTTWFKPTELVSTTDDTVIISVPNIFAKQQFESRFNNHIQQVLQKNGVNPKKILYKVRAASPVRRASISREILPDRPAEHSPLPDRPASIPKSPSSLNPKYTFESFIVGSSNDLAYTACRAVAENVGSKYNPLFIYGGVGLGKTHLVSTLR